MYTIYIENTPVLIAKKYLKNQLNDFKNVKTLFFNELANKSIIKLILEIIRDDSVKCLCLISSNPKADFKIFSKEFKKIIAAGGLVQNKSGDYLLIKRNGYWDLPKGKVEPNEEVKIAACREVQEECGIYKPLIIKELPETWHVYSLNNEWILKQCIWYLMKSDFKDELIPQIEEGITICEWKTKKEINNILPKMYPSIVHLIKQVIF